MHQIENAHWIVHAREYGAELTSLFDKKSKTEHLWQADPKFWNWHSPVLFPVIGRCLNDEIIIGGKKYKMEKHGFARKSDFRLLELDENKMIFSLTSSAGTLKFYPYKFEFLIGYRIEGNSLVVSYEVINEDYKTIYFSLGGHPAFAVPFTGSENYEGYYIEFEENENAERHFIDNNGYFNGRKETVLSNSKAIPLSRNMFTEDAFIFKNLKSRKVFLKNKNYGSFLSMDFNGFNYLGLWAKPNAPYLCIEPWLGCADAAGSPKEFSEKEGVIMLEKGKKFNVSFTIGIETGF